jgi:quercetin dioxygenase-like cupin family protein
MITRLPEIDMPIEDIKGHLLQGALNQSVFFIVKAGVFLPEHAHAAQWGIVLEGEFEIRLHGEVKTYRKGESYFIPDNTPHSGYYSTDVVSFDVFDDNKQFRLKNR